MLDRLPKLRHGDGSYVAVHRETGKAVLEMFKGDPRLPYVNLKAFKLVPIGEYLESLNTYPLSVPR